MNNTMNSAVRKIHNLLSSGAVTVTGPNQPRILKQKVGATTVTPSNNLQHHGGGTNRCYVCDEALAANQAQHQLTEMQTTHTATKFPNKIGQLVGDAFMVIVSVEDVVCTRCTNLINYLDRLENDVERVRTNLMNLLHKKYGLNDDGGGGGGGGVSVAAASPPIKMQKLNSGTATRTVEDSDLGRTRKILHTTDSTIGKQSPPVSAVQQIKINTPVQQSATGTQTIQRKTTKIYKCLSCDYKTSDMRLFNTHYETCKNQNFQCKNCKKIFPNFGLMKQHMVREHNTPMDHTCAVCHFNFMNEPALRKHMEMNHSTSVVVTSTTTLPAGAVGVGVNVAEQHGGTASLYTCNHCHFKSMDKTVFDEHLRKHLSGNKPKPFKCRLCAQRFETREAATIHAKQHQPNYFKCGTCSVSFPKRELLVKHFEVHQQQQQQQQHQQQQQQIITTQSPAVVTVKQSQSQQQLLTTQKLLQEHIDEALSENVGSSVTTAASSTTDVNAASASNIRFFSCHLCSLTFLQEHYYNQHMETHRRDKKSNSTINVSSTSNVVGGGGSTTTINSGGSSMGTLNSAAAALLSDGLHKGDEEDGDVAVGDDSGGQQAGVGGVTAASILGADIESIFEKMHSDKSDAGATSDVSQSTNASGNVGNSGANAQTNDKLVITSDEGTGSITFNITIPPQTDGDGTGVKDRENEAAKDASMSMPPVSVSIDMPVLDQADDISAPTANDASDKDDVKSASGKTSSSAPVSMPSLDDDNETAETETHDHHHQHQQATSAVSATIGDIGNEADNKEQHDKNEHDLGKTEHLNESDVKADDDVKQDMSASSTAAAADADVSASGAEGADDTEHADAVKSEEDGERAVGGAESDAATPDEHAANDAGAVGGEQQHPQQVAMELDEAMQAQVESGQIKFILNENGQLLQLDNHIITDAEGNQILVQDPEQIQQLLQSVGVLQTGDGLDGETLQMMTDGNGQMVLVQGENNETQLIDASLLNADGQLVIQQSQDGELGEGAHVIGEDGTRIPVSVSYTADGQPIVQVQQQVLEAERGQHVVLEKDGSGANVQADDGTHHAGDAAVNADNVATDDGGNNVSGGSAAGGGGSSGGGGFFALDELMQQSSEAKAAAE